MRLTQKLLISYFILIVIPLLLLTFLSNTHVSKTLIQQFEYSSDMSLHQTSIYLDKVMTEIENSIDQVAFNIRIEPSGYLYSMLLTFVFAVIVDFVMYFKLQKINMAESLKTIE